MSFSRKNKSFSLLSVLPSWNFPRKISTFPSENPPKSNNWILIFSCDLVIKRLRVCGEMLVQRRVMSWRRVWKSFQAASAHCLLFSFTLLLALKLDHVVSHSWWSVFFFFFLKFPSLVAWLLFCIVKCLNWSIGFSIMQILFL